MLGNFTRVIARIVETAALVFVGGLHAWGGFATLALPTPTGDVQGGTGPFALLACARIKDEVRAVDPEDETPPAGPGT